MFASVSKWLKHVGPHKLGQQLQQGWVTKPEYRQYPAEHTVSMSDTDPTEKAVLTSRYCRLKQELSRTLVSIPLGMQLV